MHNLLQSYLDDLRRELNGVVPADRLDTIVSECASHVNESASDLGAQQRLSEDDAFRLAIESFGTPKEVAQKHAELTRRTFLGADPKWAVLGAAMLSIAAWNFALLTMSGPFDHFGETWQNGIAAGICLAAMVVFCKACRSGQRSFFRPVAIMGAAMTLGLVALFSWWIIGANDTEQGVSRFHLARDRSKIESSISRLNGLGAYLKEGENVFARATSDQDIPEVYRSEKLAYARLELGNTSAYPVDYFSGGSNTHGQFLIPHREIYAMVDGRIWALELGRDLKSSKAAWTANAPLALTAIQSETAHMDRLLGQIESGQWFSYHMLLVWPVVIQTTVLVFLLLLLDQIMFRIPQRKRAPVHKAIV